MSLEIEYTKDGIVIAGESISLSEITRKILTKRVEFEKLALVTIKWPKKRHFDGLSEIIALPYDFCQTLKKHLVGKDVYFGEINGRHSEVYGTIEENEFTIDENVDSVVSFLLGQPDGWQYKYSFIQYFYEGVSDGRLDSYEELNKEEMDSFYTEIWNFYRKVNN